MEDAAEWWQRAVDSFDGAAAEGAAGVENPHEVWWRAKEAVLEDGDSGSSGGSQHELTSSLATNSAADVACPAPSNIRKSGGRTADGGLAPSKEMLQLQRRHQRRQQEIEQRRQRQASRGGKREPLSTVHLTRPATDPGRSRSPNRPRSRCPNEAVEHSSMLSVEHSSLLSVDDAASGAAAASTAASKGAAAAAAKAAAAGSKAERMLGRRLAECHILATGVGAGGRQPKAVATAAAAKWVTAGFEANHPPPFPGGGCWVPAGAVADVIGQLLAAGAGGGGAGGGASSSAANSSWRLPTKLADILITRYAARDSRDTRDEDRDKDRDKDRDRDRDKQEGAELPKEQPAGGKPGMVDCLALVAGLFGLSYSCGDSSEQNSETAAGVTGVGKGKHSVQKSVLHSVHPSDDPSPRADGHPGVADGPVGDDRPGHAVPKQAAKQAAKPATTRRAQGRPGGKATKAKATKGARAKGAPRQSVGSSSRAPSKGGHPKGVVEQGPSGGLVGASHRLPTAGGDPAGLAGLKEAAAAERAEREKAVHRRKKERATKRSEGQRMQLDTQLRVCISPVANGASGRKQPGSLHGEPAAVPLQPAVPLQLAAAGGERAQPVPVAGVPLVHPLELGWARQVDRLFGMHAAVRNGTGGPAARPAGGQGDHHGHHHGDHHRPPAEHGWITPAALTSCWAEQSAAAGRAAFCASMLADPAAIAQCRPAWTPAGRESMWGRRRADSRGTPASRLEAVIANLGQTGGRAQLRADGRPQLGHEELLQMAAETRAEQQAAAAAAGHLEDSELNARSPAEQEHKDVVTGGQDEKVGVVMPAWTPRGGDWREQRRQLRELQRQKRSSDQGGRQEPSAQPSSSSTPEPLDQLAVPEPELEPEKKLEDIDPWERGSWLLQKSRRAMDEPPPPKAGQHDTQAPRSAALSAPAARKAHGPKDFAAAVVASPPIAASTIRPHTVHGGSPPAGSTPAGSSPAKPPPPAWILEKWGWASPAAPAPAVPAAPVPEAEPEPEPEPEVEVEGEPEAESPAKTAWGDGGEAVAELHVAAASSPSSPEDLRRRAVELRAAAAALRLSPTGLSPTLEGPLESRGHSPAGTTALSSRPVAEGASLVPASGDAPQHCLPSSAKTAQASDEASGHGAEVSLEGRQQVDGEEQKCRSIGPGMAAVETEHQLEQPPQQPQQQEQEQEDAEEEEEEEVHWRVQMMREAAAEAEAEAAAEAAAANLVEGGGDDAAHHLARPELSDLDVQDLESDEGERRGEQEPAPAGREAAAPVRRAAQPRTSHALAMAMQLSKASGRAKAAGRHQGLARPSSAHAYRQESAADRSAREALLWAQLAAQKEEKAEFVAGQSVACWAEPNEVGAASLATKREHLVLGKTYWTASGLTVVRVAAKKLRLTDGTLVNLPLL